MTTIGDVFGVATLIFALLLAVWATMLLASLLFERATNQIADFVEAKLFSSLGVGLLVGIPLIAMIAILANVGAPFLAILLSVAVLAIAALGSGGVAVALGRKIHSLAPGTTVFSARVKGSALLPLSILLPIFGWFVLWPACFFVSLGASVKAFKAHRVWVKQVRQGVISS